MPTQPSTIRSPDAKNIGLAALYFLLSTVLTWCFIEASAGLYASHEKMLLSCAIAGGKWALQIVAAFLLLGEKRWAFIRRLGEVCTACSVVLAPYYFVAVRAWMGNAGFFASLLVAVALMIILYWRAVRKSSLPMRWFWGWMVCLAVAVTLQVTVVAE